MALLQTGPNVLYFFSFCQNCGVLSLKLTLVCSSDVVVCVMGKGALFLLVKTKLLDCTEPCCECKIHEYTCILQHCVKPTS